MTDDGGRILRQLPLAPGASLALVLGAAACLLFSPAGLAAQETTPEAIAYGAPTVDLAVEGVNHQARPRAYVQLDKPAYVAVFEIEPGVGATLLWPHGDVDERREAGRHVFRLNGLPAAVNRSLMLAHLGHRFVHRSPNQARSHLVAVTSGRPLRLDGLHSGRIFAHARGSASAAEVTSALLAAVVPSPLDSGWTYDPVSFPKFWDGAVASSRCGASFAPPFLAVHVPLEPGLDRARRAVKCPRRDGLLVRRPWRTPALPHITLLDGESPGTAADEVGDDGRIPSPVAGDPSSPDRSEPSDDADDGHPAASLSDDVAEKVRRMGDARRVGGDDAGAGSRAFDEVVEVLRDRGVEMPAGRPGRADRDRAKRNRDVVLRRIRERRERLRQGRGDRPGGVARPGASRPRSGNHSLPRPRPGSAADGPSVDPTDAIQRVRDRLERLRGPSGQRGSGGHGRGLGSDPGPGSRGTADGPSLPRGRGGGAEERPDRPSPERGSKPSRPDDEVDGS